MGVVAAGSYKVISCSRGHVCIIVNVASQCGLTATNYKELAELHEKYHESKGLRILAFPCNQFGGQVKIAEAFAYIFNVFAFLSLLEKSFLYPIYCEVICFIRSQAALRTLCALP
jgi:Glutathione peroxidase